MPRSPKVVILTKRGYRQDGYSRGLMSLHLALDTVCRQGGDGWPKKFLLSAGSNNHTKGGHAMPRCDALDVRTRKRGTRPWAFRDGKAKRQFLQVWAVEMHDGPVLRTWDHGRKVVTANYYFWLEAEGQNREHVHAQTRKGHTIR